MSNLELLQARVQKLNGKAKRLSTFLKAYDPDEARDDSGKWTSGGGSSSGSGSGAATHVADIKSSPSKLKLLALTGLGAYVGGHLGTTAGGVAGAFIGSAFGGPVGTGAGFVAGSAIGGALGAVALGSAAYRYFGAAPVNQALKQAEAGPSLAKKVSGGGAIASRIRALTPAQRKTFVLSLVGGMSEADAKAIAGDLQSKKSGQTKAA